MSQILSERVPIEEIVRTPYLYVLTYPKPDLSVAKKRIDQLRKLGVTHAVFGGKTKIGNLGLVGIGTVSVVIRAATLDGTTRALKIRRRDANRASMLEEYQLTQMANRIRVGAQVVAATSDFMVMQLIDGNDIMEHLKTIKSKGARTRVRNIVHHLLNQCRKLDLIGLDHGQLSDLRKHVIMAGDNPYIIDFESASVNRFPKNVTSTAQSLLIGGRPAPLVRRRLGLKSHDQVLQALKNYKRNMSDGNYIAILNSGNIV